MTNKKQKDVEKIARELEHKFQDLEWSLQKRKQQFERVLENCREYRWYPDFQLRLKNLAYFEKYFGIHQDRVASNTYNYFKRTGKKLPVKFESPRYQGNFSWVANPWLEDYRETFQNFAEDFNDRQEISLHDLGVIQKIIKLTRNEKEVSENEEDNIS